MSFTIFIIIFLFLCCILSVLVTFIVYLTLDQPYNGAEEDNTNSSNNNNVSVKKKRTKQSNTTDDNYKPSKVVHTTFNLNQSLIPNNDVGANKPNESLDQTKPTHSSSTYYGITSHAPIDNTVFQSRKNRFANATVDQCKTVCDSIEACVGFTFDRMNNICSMLERLPNVNKTDNISIKHEKGFQKYLAFPYNINTPYMHTMDNVHTESQCSMLCKEATHMKCDGFFFNELYNTSMNTPTMVRTCKFFSFPYNLNIDTYVKYNT